MSHEPNKKRTSPRRLAIEPMEDRLLLSISPTGSINLRDLVEIEYVPPATQESPARIDTLDFRDMAKQFNNILAAEHVGQLVPLPGLPPEGDTLALDNSVTFLGRLASTEDQASGLTVRLSDELTPIDWDTIRTDVQTSVPVPSASSSYTATNTYVFRAETSDASTKRLDGDEASLATPEVVQEHDRVEGERSGILRKDDIIKFGDEFANPDMTLNLNYDTSLVDPWSIDMFPVFKGEEAPLVLHIDMSGNFVEGLDRISDEGYRFSPQMQIDLEGITLSLDSTYYALSQVKPDIDLDHSAMVDMKAEFTPGSRHDHEGRDAAISVLPNVSEPLDLAREGGFIDNFGADPRGDSWLHIFPSWTAGAEYGSATTNNSWNTQTPFPSFYGPGVMDALQAAASMFNQNLFADETDAYNATYNTNNMDQRTSTSSYYSSQTASHSQSSLGGEAARDEEGSLFGSSSSHDGSTVKLDTDTLSFLENQADPETAPLRIEGLMNTGPEKLVDKAENHSGEEGGMIDFSVAMNWSQKPVAATPEGIVEAATRQDDKVAFEGSYGRGQTFELATAAEEEAEPEKDPTVENVSASLLKELNQTPLNTNTKENLDKTDASPVMHEVAFSQMANELDHAALLPSDALAWATFALVGQQAIRHPDDRKKKKNS